MEASAFVPVLLCSLLLLLLHSPVAVLGKPSYIVYLGGHPRRDGVSTEEAARSATESHYDLLGAVLGDREKARDAIFYSYTASINGFAATMEHDQAAEIAKYPGVVSVFPNRGRKLHTTRSWQFMGVERNNGEVPRWSAWEVGRYGEDAIIGGIDSGVWPESKSFDDAEMGPIPDTWKGICQNEHDSKFQCNRKLIGARYLNKAYAATVGRPLVPAEMTPRDEHGHGTHTLGTAGGAAVPGANAFGYGFGTARGGSPRARLAAYRICFRPVNGTPCFDADVLAGFEAAIRDGVHIISASIGGANHNYLEDVSAIGALHAAKAGITVVASAGNEGPDPGTVGNVAPWVLTVAASTMDKDFTAYAVFNHTRIEGRSLSERWMHGKSFYPLIKGADAVAPGSDLRDAEVCMLGSLDPAKVRGKIVVCVRGGSFRMEKGNAVRHAGGAGMIVINHERAGNDLQLVDPYTIPAVHITYEGGQKLLAYINASKEPSGFIIKGRTIIGKRPAPVMADYSSQGPNMVTPEILKPDVTAPGTDVLAAWTGAVSPQGWPFDKRRVAFNIMSGTSMSCPHVSGIAGLIKTLHPDWSPAAIKSAIMTSATEEDTERHPILNSSLVPATPFSLGAGHVFPSRSLDPGLVYDMTTADYLNFLCALGYNASAMETFNEAPYRCPTAAVRLHDLNYPSITVLSLADGTLPTVRRRVKNVGDPGTYTVVVQEPEGVQVVVTPTTLVFKAAGEEKDFEVSFVVRNAVSAGQYAFGAIVWSDGVHRVRSPLVVYLGLPA